MMNRLRLLVGINIHWLGLSMLFDGLDTLVLPQHLLYVTTSNFRATTLGLLTFVELIIGMLVQPIAGILSNRLHP